MKRKMMFFAVALLLAPQAMMPITSLAVTDDESSSVVAADATQDSWMPDKNLQKIVGDQLSNPDFTQADMANLTNLSISSAEITDLTGISYATNLTSLDINNTDLSNTKNLAEIGTLSKLQTLTVTNDNLSDVSLLQNSQLTSLEQVNISNNSFTNMDSFEGLQLPALKEINLSNNQIENVNGITKIKVPVIEKIDISNNKISDASPLLSTDAINSVKEMNVSNNLFTSLSSVTGINLPSLEKIDISHNQLNDVSILQSAHVPALNYIDASYNQISDISPIANSSITSLTTLIASHNQIKDVDAFANSSFTKLESLDVAYNQIGDISVMENLVAKYPSLHTYIVDHNNINNIQFMEGYDLSSNTSARDQDYEENVTLVKPTSASGEVASPILSTDFRYDDSSGYYHGYSDPEGTTLSISSITGITGVKKYDDSTVTAAELDGGSVQSVKSFMVDPANLPSEITFNWNGAQGQFSGTGKINITWVDAQAPTIEASDQTVKMGTDFDPKANVTAYDQQADGSEKVDLTNGISVINNTVDTSQAGNYSVEYSVTNSYGVTTTKTIQVTVAKTYTVTFAAGKGGSLTGNTSVEVPEGTKLTDLPQTVADESDVEDIFFLGWYQGEKAVNPADVTIDQDTTFTAKFGTAVYRLYNKNNGDHLLTKNKNEKNDIEAQGWVVETNPANEYGRAAFYVPVKADSAGKNKVYRIYNPNTGEHFYSTNKKECDAAVKAGWRQETDPNYTWVSEGDVKVYREFNPDVHTAGSHNFTTNLAEHENVVKAGWLDESKDTSLWTVLKAGF
ncbi:leucine-rich repeat domain-containing protein [Enterococcus sp. AZ103]|uniref:leucine-rich repeat domain-containing protein n=1 Tax=Enterococcus sp. AZ103 TaxID=2774628 RepID=UPI003F23BE28